MISLRAFSHFSRSLHAMITLAFLLANSRAVALPIPELAPVTTTILPRAETSSSYFTPPIMSFTSILPPIRDPAALRMTIGFVSFILGSFILYHRLESSL
uniref:Uncharacterized protein n=1 Tax=Cacopsylla melanoneura TaxID=428564 RepID=A0A8D9DTK4_9HEMI